MALVEAQLEKAALVQQEQVLKETEVVQVITLLVNGQAEAVEVLVQVVIMQLHQAQVTEEQEYKII